MMAAQGHQRRRASPSPVQPRPAVRPVEGQPKQHKLLFGLWLACQFVGFFLASYGVLRESFANLAQEPGFGEGRYRSEEHTSELQSQSNLVCRLLLEKKKKNNLTQNTSQTLLLRYCV